MTPEKNHVESTNHNRPALLMLATIAAIIAAVGCTSKAKPSMTSDKPVGAIVRPAALKTVGAPVATPASTAIAEKPSTSVKLSPKPITFKSRDYGVSFVYPWQYTFLNAKTVAKDGESLRPKPDGNDSQFTLARIEIPKGFYADTDLKNAYFMLSLNQEIGEQDCAASISPDKSGEIQNEMINGVNFRWSEMESGGHGSAKKVRNYAAFANDTCYEVEMGVKTESDGLAREVDPDQVMRRLSAVLKTVEIKSSTDSSATPQLKSSAEPKPLDSQN